MSEALSEPNFTPETANAALPGIKRRLPELREAFAELAGHHAHVRSLSDGNGADRAPGAGLDASKRVMELLSWFNDQGIIVRDVESGLIDFPSVRDGEPILLCWRQDEESVAFWHSRDTGFSARRPID